MTARTEGRKISWWALVPVLLFLLLAGLFLRGLWGDPQRLPSALVGRSVPEFTLPALEGSGVPGLASGDLKTGEVTLVNVWASWCVPSREEAGVLHDLSKRGLVRIVGINYKDKPANAARFLSEAGQPFSAIGADESGRVGVDFGVYGVPESYVVDGAGVVRYRFVGPLDQAAVDQVLLPEIAKAAKPPAPE